MTTQSQKSPNANAIKQARYRDGLATKLDQIRADLKEIKSARPPLPASTETWRDTSTGAGRLRAR